MINFCSTYDQVGVVSTDEVTLFLQQLNQLRLLGSGELKDARKVCCVLNSGNVADGFVTSSIRYPTLMRADELGKFEAKSCQQRSYEIGGDFADLLAKYA